MPDDKYAIKQNSPFKNIYYCLGIAFLYILTGKIGLEFIIPPYYSTILWPPAGICIGLLIVYGWQLWPGIILGAFILENIAFGSFQDNTLLTKNIITSFTIASGATLQALAGYFLIKKFIHIPIKIQRLRSTFIIFISCLFLASLISPAIGSLTFYIAENQPTASFIRNYYLWWIGDFTGILIFTPLVLLSAGCKRDIIFYKEKKLNSLPFLFVLCIILPLGFTFYIWKTTSMNSAEHKNHEFESLVQDNENALIYKINSYSHALMGGLAYFQNKPDLTRKDWNNYASAIPLKQYYPGINGIGVIYPVDDKDKKHFEETSKKDDGKNFKIHPDSKQNNYYVIKYIYPEESNSEAIGLNIAFEKNRKEAAEISRDTGFPTITKKITLVQDNTKSPGFLLLYPIYDQSVRLLTPEMRRAAHKGWIYSPFIAKNFLQDITANRDHYFDITIYDGSISDDNLIYTSQQKKSYQPSHRIEKTLKIMQQNWVVVWESTPAYEQKEISKEPFIILIWGLFFSILFAFLLIVFTILRSESDLEIAQEKSFISPTITLLFFLICTIVLYKSIEQKEENYKKQLIEHKADRSVTILNHNLKQILLALDRMQQRWINEDDHADNEWSEDARHYVADFPSIQNLIWVDKNKTIQKIIPIAGYEKQIGTNLLTDPDKIDFKKAHLSNYLISAPTILTKGYMGIILVFPVTSHGKEDGFIVALLSIKALFQELKSSEDLQNLLLNIKYKEKNIYSSSESANSTNIAFGSRRDFSIGPHEYKLSLSPNNEYLKSLSSILPMIVLTGGIAFSILIAITFRVALIARARATNLKIAIGEAEQANKAKSAFLSTISHEIRTPLNGVLATSELLSRTHLDQKQQKYLGIIQSAGSLLFNLLNDVLDLSKIEMEKFKLNENTFDLKKSIIFSGELFLSSAQQKGISLNIDIDPELPDYVLGDEHRFAQILSNLIGNAIKFTEQGTVDVIAKKHNIREVTYLYLQVKDTGIGIPDTSHELIFDRFSQAHNHMKISGTGLGLSICKSLIHLMDGDIGVESKEGTGSIFWLRIPLKAVEKPKAIERDNSLDETNKPIKHRALLVEDTETNQFIIADMLRILDCDVDTADNGLQALERCAQNQYDIIFMDCNMPIMDGYDATRELRRLYSKNIPILAISAHAFMQEINKCYKAGMDDYIAKPVKIDDLKKALFKWAPRIIAPAETGIEKTNSLPTQEGYLDMNLIDEIANGNIKIQNKILRMSLKNALELHKDMVSGLENKDEKKIFDSAHALKSVCGQIGAYTISNAAIKIEQKKLNLSWEDLERDIYDLTTHFDIFCKTVENIINR